MSNSNFCLTLRNDVSIEGAGEGGDEKDFGYHLS